MNTHRLSKLGILVILALVLLPGMAITITRAAPATNVGLIRFEAIPLDDAVRLEWETATEAGTAGFHLKRDGAYLNNTSGTKLFVPGEGGVATGNDYEHVDTTAVNGRTYTYELIEVETDGNEVALETRTVTAGLEPTNTPISVGGNNTGTAATATRASASPTPTASATGTPRPTASATPRPTQSALQAASATPRVATTVPADANDTDATAMQPSQSFPPQPPADEVAAIEVDDNAVLAAEPGTDPYPGPGGSDETLATPLPTADPGDEGYPPGADSLDSDAGGRAVPLIIGSDQNVGQDAAGVAPQGQETASATSTTSRLYLFGSFIVALLIFLTAVFGAIVLYTRKQSPNG